MRVELGYEIVQFPARVSSGTFSDGRSTSGRRMGWTISLFEDMQSLLLESLKQKRCCE